MDRVIAELVRQCRVHELMLLYKREPLELRRDDRRVEVVEGARRIDDLDLGSREVSLDPRLDLVGRGHAHRTLPDGFGQLPP